MALGVWMVVMLPLRSRRRWVAGARQVGKTTLIRNADDPVKGKACETFVVNELLAQASWAEVETRAYHDQRRDEDVDLVLESRAGAIACLEVKAAATLKSRDWRWLAKLRDARGRSFRAGVIVASVAQTTPLGDRLWAVPYSSL